MSLIQRPKASWCSEVQIVAGVARLRGTSHDPEFLRIRLQRNTSRRCPWSTSAVVLRPKIRRCLLFCVALVPAAMAAGCHSPFYTDKGAAVGAVTGALAGAALGEDRGDAASGAAIGSAVGLLTGAAIGDAIDQDIARNRALIEQRLGRTMAGAVAVGDVIAMTRAGLSDEIIQTHIGANGVAQRPQVPELIAMRDAGVSDRIIQSMQQAPPPPTSQAPIRHANPPVIIEEHHYAPLPYVPYGPYWRHRHPRRSGVSWGVTFGN